MASQTRSSLTVIQGLLPTFGEHPVTPSTVGFDDAKSKSSHLVSSNLPAVKDFVENMNKALQRAQENLVAAQSRMKAYKGSKRRDVSYSVGDWVWLSTRYVALSHAGTRKLENKWIGPFKVHKLVGPVACELELPGTMHIHDVFHVSLLKPWVRGRADEPPPPAILPDGTVEHEVESIIADRVRKGKTQYLVKWLGRGPEENEWMSDTDLLHCQDAVRRYLDYSLAASQAAQKRKNARLEQQTKSASQVLYDDALQLSKPR